MTKHDWNYEALGFESEAEMKESIERVERRSKMSSFELENERMAKVQHNGSDINYSELEAGARRNELDRMVQSKMNSDRQRANQQAQQEQLQSILNKAGDSIDKENKAKAERELQEAKAEADAELQKEIYSKHGIKTDEEQAGDEDLRSMVRKLNK